MDPDISKVFDGKKFMWNSVVCAGEAEARAKADSYAKDGFETRVVAHEGGHAVYTRRVVAGPVPGENR